MDIRVGVCFHQGCQSTNIEHQINMVCESIQSTFGSELDFLGRVVEVSEVIEEVNILWVYIYSWMTIYTPAKKLDFIISKLGWF